METVYILLLLETINLRDCPWHRFTEMPRCQSNSSLNKSVMKINNHFVYQVSLQPLNSNTKTQVLACVTLDHFFLFYTIWGLENCQKLRAPTDLPETRI